MDIDTSLLQRFEDGLDPQHLERSEVPAELIGYGEISAIFRIGDAPVAYKRMPLFADRTEAQAYADMYREYCELLGRTGLTLPETETALVEIPGRPVALYLAQALLPAERIGNRLMHTLPAQDALALVERVVGEMKKVWAFNETVGPDLEIAMDGQISNWALLESNGKEKIVYIDTSTPFIRKAGAHQLDPELLLQAAPGFLRWLVRWLFVADVLNRYYDPRLVLIDLTGNLFKEQLPDLVAPVIDTINRAMGDDITPLTLEEVEKYYREDKFIWALFLFLRRMDRWLTTKLFRKRYEFILPGKIKR
ncbi:MAG: hypothetical protein JEZ11_06560 [Desulfobacterales bacterium]|nr:hypothetical protein [Desulfobacterales bacterium]